MYLWGHTKGPQHERPYIYSLFCFAIYVHSTYQVEKGNAFTKKTIILCNCIDLLPKIMKIWLNPVNIYPLTTPRCIITEYASWIIIESSKIFSFCDDLDISLPGVPL